jgi:hypothetical protein
VALSDAQTGTGPSTNVADRGVSHKSDIVVITPIIGATPTCTYAIEVSTDNVTFGPATYADITTPTTDVATTFVATTAAVIQKIVKQQSQWRYLRLTYSANTNVTNTAVLHFSDARRLP